MKKVAIVALMIIAIVGSMLGGDAKPGGIARQVAMGGSQAGTNLILNPFIMDDPSLVLVNPAYQSMYSNYGWMNIAGGSVSGLTGFSNAYGHQNAGVAFGLNDEWTLGAILSYDPSAVNAVNTLMGSSGIMQRGAQAMPGVANVWEIVVSNHMGSLDWGVGVMYGSSNTDTKSSTTAVGPPPTTTSTSSEASSSVLGFRAGVNAPFGSGNSLDVSAALRLDKATDKISPASGTTAGDYSASGTEIQITARAKFNVSSKFNFVPYGMFTTLSAEPKEDAFPTGGAVTPNKVEYSASAYAFGVGGEYHTSQFYFAGGLSWQSVAVEVKGSSTVGPTSGKNNVKYSALPVMNLGGEWWFTDWLAGRAGYYRSLGSVNVETEGTGPGGSGTTEFNLTIPNSLILIGDFPTNTDEGLITLGLGMRFGGWAMDATVSEEALRRGLGLIGGGSDNPNTFGYITASFNFAGE